MLTKKELFDIFRVKCPTCGAHMGKVCTYANGEHMPIIHQRRRIRLIALDMALRDRICMRETRRMLTEADEKFGRIATWSLRKRRGHVGV